MVRKMSIDDGEHEIAEGYVGSSDEFVVGEQGRHHQAVAALYGDVTGGRLKTTAAGDLKK